MKKSVELSSTEDGTCCRLNIISGEKTFFSWKELKGTSEGFYYYDGTIFFALIESKEGPQMYYEGRLYPLSKELNIRISKMEENRTFVIEEYGICIQYVESKYIGFDVWSKEIDVDLFYMIEQLYKTEDFYKKFTV